MGDTSRERGVEVLQERDWERDHERHLFSIMLILLDVWSHVHNSGCITSQRILA